MAKSKRLLALDVLRGITIAGMLMVNNSAGQGYVYMPLEHSAWNGLTMADLVFPFFMFIMGVSLFFSLSKCPEGLKWKTLYKILLRSVLMFAIGIGLACVLMLYKNSSLRVLGVIQRLAMAYFGGAVIALALKNKKLLLASGIILLVYSIILWLGNGFEQTADNIVGKFDTFILNPANIYSQKLADGSRIPFDPEGLLSTLPCFAHVLLGVHVGKVLKEDRSVNDKLLKIFLFGTISLFAGFILKDILPINKRVWSPTFVLITCGTAALLLALLIWIIDVKGKRRWTPFFESFGVNPLFLYVIGTILGYTLNIVKVPFAGQMASLRNVFYTTCLKPVIPDPYLASLCYSLLFVMIIWLVAQPLYKKNIIIKI